MRPRATVLALLLTACPAFGHDIWLQTGNPLIRTGDAVHVDLMLGNHGNDHRDFKLASKPDPAAGKLTVRTPDGRTYDVNDRLVDLGYAPKEGFLSAKFVTDKPGVYAAAYTSDNVVTHGQPVRSVRSAKTFFLASPTLDNVKAGWTGHEKPFGHPIELVPVANPLAPMGPGTPIKVKLLYEGKPLIDTKVSFIPRGETLAEGFDKTYERMTDKDGRASFTPKTGNMYLVVARHKTPAPPGANHASVQYTATLTVLVPEVCPCCGGD